MIGQEDINKRQEVEVSEKQRQQEDEWNPLLDRLEESLKRYMSDEMARKKNKGKAKGQSVPQGMSECQDASNCNADANALTSGQKWIKLEREIGKEERRRRKAVVREAAQLVQGGATSHHPEPNSASISNGQETAVGVKVEVEEAPRKKKTKGKKKREKRERAEQEAMSNATNLPILPPVTGSYPVNGHNAGAS